VKFSWRLLGEWDEVNVELDVFNRCEWMDDDVRARAKKLVENHAPHFCADHLAVRLADKSLKLSLNESPDGDFLAALAHAADFGWYVHGLRGELRK